MTTLTASMLKEIEKGMKKKKKVKPLPPHACLKKVIKDCIEKTRPLRFDIEAQHSELTTKYKGDADDVCGDDFGVVVAVCTRVKIHRLLDVVLNRLKSFVLPDDDVMVRIQRLVPKFLKQLDKLMRNNVVTAEQLITCATYYNGLLRTVPDHIEWLRALS